MLAQHTDRWLVSAEDGGGPWLAHARGRLRGDPPVTGDWVLLDEGGAIGEVCERRGVVARRAVSGATRAQVLAANVDLALVVEPFPDPNPRRAERIVAVAQTGGVESALVLSKADLAPDGDADEVAMRMGRTLGLVDSVAVCARSGDGVGVLRSLVTPDRTAVLLGPSGAGKSTLANCLLGADRLEVGEVRFSDGRGRHTTVTRDLVTLPNGAGLIDTPGLREAGLWDGVGETFADIDALAAQCRFNDCAHESEPDCAVREGADPERLAAWRKLQAEQKWLDDRKAAARDREARGRSYERVQREARGMKGDDDA